MSLYDFTWSTSTITLANQGDRSYDAMAIDRINEKTSAHGVDFGTVTLCKDNTVTTDAVLCDTVNGDATCTIDGVVFDAGEVTVGNMEFDRYTVTILSTSTTPTTVSSSYNFYNMDTSSASKTVRLGDLGVAGADFRHSIIYVRADGANSVTVEPNKDLAPTQYIRNSISNYTVSANTTVRFMADGYDRWDAHHL